uniref:Uncharacterized protein n=1 Tax=Oryza meridionalis TaxID=40149 RepID=A0A0E0FBQ4_9ORYZ
MKNLIFPITNTDSIRNVMLTALSKWRQLFVKFQKKHRLLTLLHTAERKEETLDVTAAPEEDVEEVRPEIGAGASGLRFSLSAAVAVAVKWESQVLNVPFGLEQWRWTCHSTTNPTEVALAA